MEIDEETMFADGFENAFIGLGTRAGKQVAVYDKQKILEQLATEMTEQEAIEYYEFNIESANIGERTPIFVESCNLSDLIEGTITNESV